MFKSITAIGVEIIKETDAKAFFRFGSIQIVKENIIMSQKQYSPSTFRRSNNLCLSR